METLSRPEISAALSATCICRFNLPFNLSSDTFLCAYYTPININSCYGFDYIDTQHDDAWRLQKQTLNGRALFHNVKSFQLFMYVKPKTLDTFDNCQRPVISRWCVLTQSCIN